MTELSRLRREHAKAYRRWKATRKPRHWEIMRDIVTKIMGVSSLRSSGRTAAIRSAQ